MKVMHFHFGKDGGAERFFVRLCNALAKHSVEQVSIIRPNRGWIKDIENSTRVIESHFRNFSLDKVLLPYRVQRLVKTWKPDVILGWMPKGAKLIPQETSAVRLVRLGDYPEKLTHFSNVDAIICNTPGIASRLRDLGWQREVHIISNFVDNKIAEPVNRAAVDTPENAFVISAMGRFVSRKGFDVLIDALKFSPDTFLWIIGDGELSNELKAQSLRLGVADRTRFIGWQKNPAPFLRASNAFAMASNHEPLGNVCLEAWSQNIPVVSTSCEGPSWYIKDGINGLLVQIGDAAGFSEAFRRLREDGQLRSKLVAGGENTLRTTFSEDSIVNAYMTLFNHGGNIRVG